MGQGKWRHACACLLCLAVATSVALLSKLHGLHALLWPHGALPLPQHGSATFHDACLKHLRASHLPAAICLPRALPAARAASRGASASPAF